jgi:hypothetical protein
MTAAVMGILQQCLWHFPHHKQQLRRYHQVYHSCSCAVRAASCGNA